MTPRANGIDVDIVMVSDFRFPGGTSTCIAEEIRAQARAGYTTGLLPITAPILTQHRAFHPEIMACIRGGMARLLAPDVPVATRLLLLHQPLAFAGKIDLPAWAFGLPDAEYQGCSPAHVAAGFTTAPDGGRMSINVEVIGGSLMVQHYTETLGEKETCIRSAQSSTNCSPVVRRLSG